MSLYLKLKEQAEKKPYARAIIDNDKSFSYSELMNSVDRAASGLKSLNINKDDHVGMLCMNQYEYVMLLFAASKIGAITVPVNCMQQETIIEYTIFDSGIKMLFVSEEIFHKYSNIISLAEEKHIKIIVISRQKSADRYFSTFEEFMMLPQIYVETETSEDNVAVMLYTSGTTGMPRGVLLTHKNLISNVNGFFNVTKLPEGDSAILALPLFHAFGQIVLLVCLFNCITTILIQQFAPQTILKNMVTYKTGVLPLVPTMFDIIITAAEKKNITLDFVNYCVTGGASISTSLYRKIIETTGARIIEGYGLTETSPVITISQSEICYKENSVGKPIPGVKVRLEEDGEISISGNSVFKGYWNDIEANMKCFTPDGYFRTGDTGYIDNEGYVYITDRKKDIIIRAGENISPKQIEDVLYQFEALRDVAVFGVKDLKLGEAILCAIETEAELDKKELRQYCKNRLPAHMIPEDFILMPQLPRNVLGKVLKFKLRETFARQLTVSGN
jgi:long-chain acyl-CoA synthetase